MLNFKNSFFLTALLSFVFTTVSSANTEPVIISQPKNVAQCIGGTEVLSVVLKEGIKATFQWQKSIDNASWKDINEAKNADFRPNSNEIGTVWYRVAVTLEGENTTTYSQSAYVVVAEMPTLRVTVANGTICLGEKAILKAIKSGGAGDCTIQWQSFKENEGWKDIEGQTKDTITVELLDEKSQYRAKLTCAGNGCDCN
jgi:hypothetical protein